MLKNRNKEIFNVVLNDLIIKNWIIYLLLLLTNG
jgi:hypothetical protein